MIVKKHGGGAVTPIGPIGEGRKGGTRLPHERIPIDQVEGIFEVDLQESQVGVLVTKKNITEGMGNYFDTTGAPNTIILALEHSRDVILAYDTKTLAHQPAQGIAAAE